MKIRKGRWKILPLGSLACKILRLPSPIQSDMEHTYMVIYSYNDFYFYFQVSGPVSLKINADIPAAVNFQILPKILLSL